VIFFLNGKIKNQKSLVKRFKIKSKINTLEVILNQNQKSQRVISNHDFKSNDFLIIPMHCCYRCCC